METLEDVNCRSCSLKATAERLQEQIDAAEENESADITKMRKTLHLIQERISSNRIEEPIDSDIQLTKVLSQKSTKQVMFAKPPKSLCLHISRSAFHPSGAVYKNTCQVTFPEILDLTPYCTNSNLKVHPDMPMSSPSELSSGTDTQQRKYQYKLMSTIVHYGSHNFGHFIAYKRRLEQCGCHSCINTRHTKSVTSTTSTQHDWYRLSDEKVDTCSVQDVLKANPYMLIYELIEDEPSEPEVPVVESIQPPLTNTNINPTPIFKKSSLHTQLTNSSIHKLSMSKTVSATIQATALSGSKIQLPDSFETGIQIQWNKKESHSYCTFAVWEFSICCSAYSLFVALTFMKTGLTSMKHIDSLVYLDDYIDSNDTWLSLSAFSSSRLKWPFLYSSRSITPGASEELHFDARIRRLRTR